MLILKGLTGGLFQLALFGILLIVPAGLVSGGTWYWQRALLFIGVYGFILGAIIVWLAVVKPASLEARLKAPASKKQPAADRVVTAFLGLSLLAWFVFIPIEVFYLRLLPPPQFAVSVFGAVLALAAFVIMIAAIYKNSFAISTVEDQAERGQVLVNTGPYARVRHPLYIGLLAWAGGIGLWLESYASVIAVTLILVVLMARIIVEEKTLRTTLPGYPEYMEKVRYRLVPFVW